MSKRRFAPTGRESRKKKRKGALQDPLLRMEDDEEITSEESGAEEKPSDAEKSEVDAQTAADERRIRLAKKILAELEQEQRLKQDDLGEDYIQNKLLEDVLKRKGRHFDLCAERMMESLPAATVTIKRGHRHTATSVAVGTQDGREYAYTGSKDGSITRWDLATKKVVHKIPCDYWEEAGHRGAIYGLAISGDGKLLASGGRDRHIRLWSTETHEIVKVFKNAHKDSVTCLAFQDKVDKVTEGSDEDFYLFSGSADRHVIIWDCEAGCRVHRAIGHNSRVTHIHCIGQSKAMSSGDDCTLRLWDVARDKQRIYQKYKCPIDSCSMLSPKEFVSGAMGGQVSLWSTGRKKPTCTLTKVHGENWVTSIASIPYTDLAVSGSCDGFLRFFKKKGAEIFDAGKLEIRRGWVNNLKFSKSSRFLVGAVGRDHRFGRWNTIKGARNGILIVDFEPITAEEAKPLIAKPEELNGASKPSVKNKMETDSSSSDESSSGDDESSSGESSSGESSSDEESASGEESSSDEEDKSKMTEGVEKETSLSVSETEKPKTSENLQMDITSEAKGEENKENLSDGMDINGGATESSAKELPGAPEVLGKDISEPSLPENSD